MTLHVYQCPIQQYVWDVTALNGEIFILYGPSGQDAVIHVHDRNNIAEIKDVISLPGRCLGAIAACNVSNCVYAYLGAVPSVVRITKDEEHQFNISPFINDSRIMQHCPTMSVSANGSLLFFLEEEREAPPTVAIYNANGFLQHEIMFPQYAGEMIRLAHLGDTILKSNGNIVLVTSGYNKRKLLEMDLSGNVVREYQSSLDLYDCVTFEDRHGRILITDVHMGMELIDAEYNLLDFSFPQLDKNRVFHFMHSIQ